jgi:hypothetical protein
MNRPITNDKYMKSLQLSLKYRAKLMSFLEKMDAHGNSKIKTRQFNWLCS